MRYKISKQYRLKEYDYSQVGCYYVTICVKNKKTYFGKVIAEKVVLSAIGEIAKRSWLKLPDVFKEIELDQFVVMPNHFHGIIIIKECRNAPRRVLRMNAPRRVPTVGIRPLIPNSLSSIINHFKGAVKKCCKRNGFEYFAWQSRFYDRVVRNEKEMINMREYILNNPLKWHLDENNPEKL